MIYYNLYRLITGAHYFWAFRGSIRSWSNRLSVLNGSPSVVTEIEYWSWTIGPPLKLEHFIIA